MVKLLRCSVFGFGLALAWMAIFFLPRPPVQAQNIGQVTPTPTIDRLAIPTLPPNPSLVESGEVEYYYHCMPCHGDRGQGLTDEWRAVWVEDHQNCWGRGCHAGREKDEGFPIPTTIPAVISPTVMLRSAESLYLYLKHTHPPQNPGGLSDQQYQALAAFLEFKNQPAAPPQPTPEQNGLKLALLGCTAAGLALTLARLRQRRRSAAPPTAHPPSPSENAEG